MQNDDDQVQDDNSQAQSKNPPSQADLEKEVDNLMEDFNLDADQAAKVVELLDEGESEEDAVADALDS